MRPPEPSFVIAWREFDKKGPPKCCHTCEWYSKNGQCEKHQMAPPVEFASTEEDCEDWIREIPF